MQSYVRHVYVRFLVLGLMIIVFAVTGFSQNMFRKMNDFDGDGKADLAVVRTVGDFQVGFYKLWYIWQSRDGFKAFRWGVGGDMLAPGDYDGDGKTDIAVLRPTNQPPLIHYFWIWNSGSNNFTQVGFENVIPALKPMQQDYNGDGKTDPAVWIGSFIEPPGSTPTTVYAKYSSTNTWDLQFQIAQASAPNRAGDLTGDGRADNVHGVPGGISITNIVTGTTNIVPGGISGRVVPGDFDGDGTGELALWRSSDGMWWWLRSSDNTVRQFRWGSTGDIPVPADYDGDGITDVAIWRPGSDQAYYWIYGSQSGSSVVAWGLSGDAVVEP